MPDSIQQHAAERLAFAAGTPVADRLTACKVFLKEEMAELRARHEGGASGLEIAVGRSRIMDAMLSRLFDVAVASYGAERGEPPTTVTLVAMGGMGGASSPRGATSM